LGKLVIESPDKKTRIQAITSEQKQENKKKARKIIVVEHLIRSENF
jgi:hypothetical protein